MNLFEGPEAMFVGHPYQVCGILWKFPETQQFRKWLQPNTWDTAM